MKEYLFVFGRNPELSFLEVDAFLKARKITYEVRETGKEVAVIVMQEIKEDLANILGGTVRIGEVIAKNTSELESINFEFTDKIRININVYANASSYLKVRSYFKEKCKEESVKYVLTKNAPPSKLKRNHIEILIFKQYIAKTISLFDPLQYKERDNRPYNDYLKNTSIRLARILINLGGVEKGILLDPFCGTGVILQEALLLGYNVLGIDNNRESVLGTIKNIEWLKQKYNVEGSFQVLQRDARNIPFQKCDLIVTEPYLGHYIRGTLTMKEAQERKKQLERIYQDFFKNIKPCRIVFIIPCFQTKKGKVKLTNVFVNCKVLEGPILYFSQKSKIIREIYVLEKK